MDLSDVYCALCNVGEKRPAAVPQCPNLLVQYFGREALAYLCIDEL